MSPFLHPRRRDSPLFSEDEADVTVKVTGGTAVDHERLIDPLLDGHDGGLVEEREGLEDPDGRHAPWMSVVASRMTIPRSGPPGQARYIPARPS